MKTLRKVLIAASLVLFAAGSVWAVRGPQGVAYTLHNLSAVVDASHPNNTFAQPYMATNEEEICIFCHTPHGGSLDGPLWNRSMPAAAGYTHYNSATLTAAAGDKTRPVSKESLLCLSCHDGSIAVNRILNPGQNGAPDNSMKIQVDPLDPVPGSVIGASLANMNATDDLSDDHPISFSYTDAYTEEQASGVNGLRDVATAEANGVRFFGNDKRVECSSCHDPHVSYDPFLSGFGASYTYDTKYRPFLITPNTGSALCLACHVK